MIRSLAAVSFLLLPVPALAEVPVIDHAAFGERALSVLDQEFAAFRDASGALETAARAYCDGKGDRAALDQAFRATWRAWAPLDSYQFGPIEQSGAALSVNFWPDKKGFVPRGLDAFLAQPEAAQGDPEAVAAGSVAIQGLPAIELLLTTDRPACPAISGISGHLAGVAAGLYAGWFDAGGWADVVRSAGAENPVYRSPEEFTAAIFTALDFGLFRIREQRLERPLGTFERSFPERAEAWRSGLTAEIIDAQLAGIAEMLGVAFAGTVPAPDLDEITGDIAATRQRLAAIGLPIAEAVADPATRIRVEAIQTRIAELKAELSSGIGVPLGLEAGFSAADGD